MEPNTQNEGSNKGIIMSVVAIVLVVGAFLGFRFFSNTSSSSQNGAPQTPVDTTSVPPVDTTPQGTSTPVSTEASTTPVIMNSKYKDGTYSADGNYQSPGGNETIKVTLVLKDGIVTSATVVGTATEGGSKFYQDKFIGGFKQYVVGKSIDAINVTKVSGSSLTPIGFNAALAKIKTQAQA